MQEQTPAVGAIQTATPTATVIPASPRDRDLGLLNALLVAGVHSQDGRARLMEVLGVDGSEPGLSAAQEALSRLLSNAASPYVLGGSYFVCTVTKYFTGRLVAVTHEVLIFEQVAWVADTGRLGDFLAKGAVDELQMEIEPYPDGVSTLISRGALIDVTPWRHPLPRKQSSGKKAK